VTPERIGDGSAILSMPSPRADSIVRDFFARHQALLPVNRKLARRRERLVAILKRPIATRKFGPTENRQASRWSRREGHNGQPVALHDRERRENLAPCTGGFAYWLVGIRRAFWYRKNSEIHARGSSCEKGRASHRRVSVFAYIIDPTPGSA
jgi:hypothetical protein